MKKVLSALLAAMMVFSLAACRGGDTSSAATPDDTNTETSMPVENTGDENTGDADALGDWKIGLVTGTVSQGEEEFQMAQMIIDKYGADRIVHITYPDNFTAEAETMISQVASLADDPDIKAIVYVQAVLNASAAIDKVRETRPDMLVIAGVAADDPPMIAERADVVFLVDEPGMGVAVPTQAQELGATTLIHYSFARHLGMATIANRRDIMKATCEELGIDFVEVTAPDPTSDAGVAGAQQFIQEDVPRQVATYGKDTAFFATNCSMQEPLISTILSEGAIFPQQCCPSPFHGYPAALNIETVGHEADTQYMLDQISEKVEEGGNAGRMSTWKLPVNMVMIEAGVEYAIRYLEGEITERHDDAAVRSIITDIAKNDYNADATVGLIEYDGEVIDNFYLLLADYYTF